MGLQVGGCYTDFGPVAAVPEPTSHVSTVANRLQAGESLRVVIYGEEALTGTYVVNPAGDIIMPLIGERKRPGLRNPSWSGKSPAAMPPGNFCKSRKSRWT